jgi:hypothetical protein
MSDEKTLSPSQLRKLKKRLKLEKNKRTQLINLHEDQHARERNLEKERDSDRRKVSKKSGRAPGEKSKDGEERPWSARMQEVRNRIDGKKRMANDRWNRFAGTDGAGAMGR